MTREGYDAPTGRLDRVTHNTEHWSSYTYQPGTNALDTTTFKHGSGSVLAVSTRHLDKLGRLQAVEWNSAVGPDDQFTYSYDAHGQRTRVDKPDGSYWSYGYDDKGQVTSGKRMLEAGPPGPTGDTYVAGQQFEYAFDDIGNRTQTGVGGNGSGSALRTATYSPNLLNQYTSRQVPSGADVMGFAPAANSPVTVGGSPADYRWGRYFQELVNLPNSTSAQFTPFDLDYNGTTPPEEQQWVFVAQTPENFTYDADGNLTQDGHWNYEWDCENRLKAVETRTGLPATVEMRRYEYAYDYMSRRSQKTRFAYIGGGMSMMGQGPAEGDKVQDASASSVTKVDEEEGEQLPPSSNNNQAPPVNWEVEYWLNFVWDGWNLMDEIEYGQSHARGYAWGLDLSGSLQGAGGVGGLLWETIKGDAERHVCTDGNGNVTGAFDDDGYVTASIVYGPFGETLTSEGDNLSQQMVRFSSKYSDEETGLVYYGYRYYSPGTGRWVSRDPAGESGGINLEVTCVNSPLFHIDTLGLRPWVATFSGINSRDDYVARALRARGIGVDWSWHSQLGTTRAYEGTGNRIGSGGDVQSETRLNREAHAESRSRFGEGAACKTCPPSGEPSKSRIHVIMLAPKTHKLPDVGICCTADIDVLWSPYDNVPNQSPWHLEGESMFFWSQWGTVHILDTRTYTDKDDPSLLRDLVDDQPYPNHAIAAFLLPVPRLVPNTKPRGWYQGSEMGGMAPDVWDPWVRSGTISGASMIRQAINSDVEHVWVCHSQGCNMAMHSLARVCNARRK